MSYLMYGNNKQFDYDIPMVDTDVETTVIKECLLEELRRELSLMEDKDREFLLMCFDDSFSIINYSKEVGIPFQTLQSRRNRLVKELRKKMLDL